MGFNSSSVVLCAGFGIPGGKKRGRPKSEAAGTMRVVSAESIFRPRFDSPVATPKAAAPSQRGHVTRKPPPLNYTVRGQAPTAALTPDEASRIMETFQDEMSAPSSRASRNSHINAWEFYTKRWFGSDEVSLPLTEEKIFAVAAQFKAQGYRSFSNYVDTMSDIHKESHEWTAGLDRARKKSLASTQRGIGPPKQCSEVPVTDIAMLKLSAEPLVEGGPICPGEWATINSFHLTRGAESACALASSVSMNAERRTYDWMLPVSKTDPQAIGCTRSWGCVCLDSAQGPCPYHAMSRLMAELYRRFGIKDELPDDLPLFPNASGDWVAREAFVQTISKMAQDIGVATQDEMGRCTIGEHVWRISGARHLAALDIPTAVIMRLARWGCAVVLRYIADAPLGSLTRVYINRVRESNVARLALISGYNPSSSAASSSTSVLPQLLEPLTQQDAEASLTDDEPLAEEPTPGQWLKYIGS